MLSLPGYSPIPTMASALTSAMTGSDQASAEASNRPDAGAPKKSSPFADDLQRALSNPPPIVQAPPQDQPPQISQPNKPEVVSATTVSKPSQHPQVRNTGAPTT